MSASDASKAERLVAARERLERAKAAREAEEKQAREAADDVKRAEYELERREKEALRLKMFRVRLQQSMETEEEYITNNLIKKLDALQKEKQELLQQAEREEEFIANTLQTKLEKIKREKIDIENRLEQEQEHIVNKLQQELLRVSEEKSLLQAKLHSSRGAVLKQLGEHAAGAQGGPSLSVKDTETITKLISDISRLQEENTRAESKTVNYERERKQLHTRLDALRKENRLREKEHTVMKHELERVTKERKNLFLMDEQNWEKRFNSILRGKKRRSSRMRSASELSATDSLSSSLCSSSLSTPKVIEPYSLPPAPLALLSAGDLYPPPLDDDRRRSSSVPAAHTARMGYSGCHVAPTTPTLTTYAPRFPNRSLSGELRHPQPMHNAHLS